MGKVISKPSRLLLLKRKKKSSRKNDGDSDTQTGSSASSSLRETTFVYIDNRKYHNTDLVPSIMPADDDESDRTSGRHFLSKAEWGNTNFSSPVHEALLAGGSAVDIGCGGAAWLLDMATEYTSGRFVGVALDDVHPVSIKPRNLDFLQCNVLDGVPVPDGTYDFVYARFMSGAIPEPRWPEFISELVRITKSGGFIEIHDADYGWINDGPCSQRLRMLANETLYRLYKINLNLNRRIPRWFKDTGQVRNITQYCVRAPVGGETKAGKAHLEIAYWGGYNIKAAVNAYGMSDEEYDSFLKSVYYELKDKEVLEPAYRTFAQKI